MTVKSNDAMLWFWCQLVCSLALKNGEYNYSTNKKLRFGLIKLANQVDQWNQVSHWFWFVSRLFVFKTNMWLVFLLLIASWKHVNYSLNPQVDGWPKMVVSSHLWLALYLAWFCFRQSFENRSTCHNYFNHSTAFSDRIKSFNFSTCNNCTM